MRKKVHINCPHCNKLINLLLSKGRVEIDTALFDIDTQEVQDLLKAKGYEFGCIGGDYNRKA